jgi:peptidoglycan hydrolase-like protein with peptidoglycan-binding domain
MWDYEHAYPGGPMVAVLGFPRPLYPPDDPQRENSVDGSDIEAYKRTISRLGRWEWQTFDQAYSNGFSHGKSGNVGESGVEGFQRQMNIQATGNIGSETFNALRSAKIPAGLPNSGQYGMDARSVELINAAYKRFGGEEPGPEGSTKAQARLKKAVSQIGYSESGNNNNKYGQWYGMNYQPWCAMFVTWCDVLSENPSDYAFAKGIRYSYCPYVVNDARLGYYGLSIVSTPKPGDLVLYDWSRDGEYQHIGIFESGNATNWQAIEGNTSTSNNSNGGQVMRRFRSSSGINRLFVRVKE